MQRMMTRGWFGILAVVLCGPLPAGAAAPDGPGGFFLRGGERIVFFGDSITQGGQYVTNVEYFLLTRLPEQQFAVINHGISSETISGTSEPDHDPRRPWAHERFDRDVAAWKPDVLVACFGMNDGNYHPPDDGRMAKYQAGIRRLIDRARAAGVERIALLTPPPFDAYQRKSGDPQAVHYGYKFAYIGYDETLAGYAAWLRSMDEPGVSVVDLHTALNEHLRARRQTRVSFTLAPDAVHPNATGHWLMAQTLLGAWQAPATADEVRLVCDPAQASAAAAVDATPAVRLPLVFDPAVEEESLAVAESRQRLGGYTLRVEGLPAGNYEVRATWRAADEHRSAWQAAAARLKQPLVEGEIVLGPFEADHLAAGIDLNGQPKFPLFAAARLARSWLAETRQQEYQLWRKAIAATPESPPADIGPEPATAAARAELRRLVQPQPVRLRIVRASLAPASAAPPGR